ncbi:helix-turn-helix domain-containing protein [Coprobacillaceae bacterium CR2/5/TPMF4]|nr:helix-turn-helix domain-containing protein [Coprobacillaceae bacterium CR2/5/TPMF4]
MLKREKQDRNCYQDDFLKIDFNLAIVEVNQKVCSITPTEYRILKKFIENKGQLLTYNMFLDALWQEGVQLMDKHALAVNINRLRKKIEDENHSYITNVYGMGYIWK